MLTNPEGREVHCKDRSDFVSEALRQIERLETVDAVYAFWSRNSAAFGKLKLAPGDSENIARKLAEALKERARQVGQAQTKTSNGATDAATPAGEQTTGSYLIPKEKRVRDSEHLAFVASQPCLICGRRPAQAHHLRFAQPRAMAMKVSDEFTVPVCNTHHDQLHRSGDERAFWAQHGIREPLKFAARLWEASRNQRNGATGERQRNPRSGSRGRVQ